MEDKDNDELLLDSFGVTDGIQFLKKFLIRMSVKVENEINKHCENDDVELLYDWIILKEKILMVKALVDKL